jgi:hypothetical protein
MVRALFRLVLVLIILVGVGGFLLGWWTYRPEDGPAVGTTGSAEVERAREIGAQVGEKTAQAADQARRAVS